MAPAKKRKTKTKEEIAAEIKQKQDQKKLARFKELFDVFVLEALEETGFMLVGRADYSPDKGLTPQIGIKEAPEGTLEKLIALREKLAEEENESGGEGK